QSAIDSLREGDTLYLYPGQYWTDEDQEYGIYMVNGINSGTEERPVIITAHDQNNPPVIHSVDPNGVGSTGKSAITTNWDENVHHVIFDHLFIDGLIQVRGHHNIIQFSEGVTGWAPPGDGNWAVFRLDNCNDCVAHHNYAHDVEGEGVGCDGPDRGAGLKEFSSNRAIWEFNRVEHAPCWGYDLHRDSLDSTVRFNQIVDAGNVGIRFGGGSSPHAYGNVVHDVAWCMQHLERDMGVTNDEFFNNTCSYTNRNLISYRDFNLEFYNNIISNTEGAMPQNLGVQPKNTGVTAYMDYNAYDSNAVFYYDAEFWGDGEAEASLSAWQSRFTGQELHSQEAAGGACSFVDAPTSASDLTFDFTPTDTFCTTGSSEGGLLGPYGLVTCIGHTCGDVGGSLPEPEPQPEPEPEPEPEPNPIDLSENSFVSLNPRMVSASVMSLADNNIITAGGRTLELNLYQRASLYDPNQRVITPGMVIKGTGAFELGSSVGVTDTPVHASMLGRVFVMPHSRYNHTYHMISPQGNASVQINVEGTISTHSLTQGELFNFETGEVNGNVGVVITSDLPILVSHTALASWGGADASPVPPAATELWGVCSGSAYVSAVEDDTQVTIFDSTSSAGREVALNAGEKRYICPSLSWSERGQGRGPAIHIVSNKPVGAVQIADGDGGDQTVFYPTSLLKSRYGIPKNSQYIAINCPSANTSVTLYGPDGSADTRHCDADGDNPGKVLFGNPDANGAHISQGSYLESTRPVYVIYEVTGSEGEHNLIGTDAYVTPLFSADMEGSDWMDVRSTETGGGTITFPIVDNNRVAQFNYREGSSNQVWLRHNFGAYPGIDEPPVEELWLNVEYEISDTVIYNPNPGQASKILYVNWSSPTDKTRTSQVVLGAINNGNGHRFRMSREVFNPNGSWAPGGEWLVDPAADPIPVNEKLYLQLHIRNSTDGAANGFVELYNNGELVFERSNVVLHDDPGHSPNHLVLTPQISHTPPGSGGDGYARYDNVSIYDTDPGPFMAP
ncbi:MAG: hypothetical protein P8163_01910, partial [Candidatus Thiodiazotropha sp.]